MCEGVDLPHFDKSVVTQAWSCQLFLQIKMGSHTASEWKKLDAALPAVCWREFDRSFVTLTIPLEQSEAINNLIQHLRWYLRRLPTMVFFVGQANRVTFSNEWPKGRPFWPKGRRFWCTNNTKSFLCSLVPFFLLPAYIQTPIPKVIKVRRSPTQASSWRSTFPFSSPYHSPASSPPPKKL